MRKLTDVPYPPLTLQDIIALSNRHLTACYHHLLHRACCRRPSIATQKSSSNNPPTLTPLWDGLVDSPDILQAAQTSHLTSSLTQLADLLDYHADAMEACFEQVWVTSCACLIHFGDPYLSLSQFSTSLGLCCGIQSSIQAARCEQLEGQCNNAEERMLAGLTQGMRASSLPGSSHGMKPSMVPPTPVVDLSAALQSYTWEVQAQTWEEVKPAHLQATNPGSV